VEKNQLKSQFQNLKGATTINFYSLRTFSRTIFEPKRCQSGRELLCPGFKFHTLKVPPSTPSGQFLNNKKEVKEGLAYHILVNFVVKAVGFQRLKNYWNCQSDKTLVYDLPLRKESNVCFFPSLDISYVK